jgi:hypothetical protein
VWGSGVVMEAGPHSSYGPAGQAENGRNQSSERNGLPLLPPTSQKRVTSGLQYNRKNHNYHTNVVLYILQNMGGGGPRR